MKTTIPFHIWYYVLAEMPSAKYEFDSENLSDTFISETCPGPLFTKQTDVLPKDLVKSRSREIGCYNDCIEVKFYMHRQHCCRGTYQISERFEQSKPESRGFETSRDLMVRCPFAFIETLKNVIKKFGNPPGVIPIPDLHVVYRIEHSARIMCEIRYWK